MSQLAGELSAAVTTLAVSPNLDPPLGGAARAKPLIVLNGCSLQDAGVASRPCVYGDATSHVSVALFGDSHAAAWFPALDLISKQHHWRLVDFTKAGCPAGEVTIWFGDVPYRQCTAWRRDAEGQIAALHPALVIVSGARWMEYLAHPEQGVPTGYGSAWLDGLAATFNFLRHAAGHVVFISDVPTLPFSAPGCAATHPFDADRCTTSRRTAVLLPQIKSAELALANRLHVNWIDPTSWFCARRACPAVVGRILLYRDNAHMTPAWSRHIAPLLAGPIVPIMLTTSPVAASASAHRQAAARPVAHVDASRKAGRGRPNIVFVLTDDLSMDLIRYMPQVQALERRGLTFHNYFVSDSLCCPSRASIFTGDFPHDTHVTTNTPPDGGFAAFHTHGDEDRSFNLALQRVGYQTAMMGKYLNGYLYEPGVSASYIPPGWNTWDVAGWGYPEYDYHLNDNGTVRYYGHRPDDYLTDVLTRYGVRFIDHAARAHRPFFLELATFAPHTPYTPAPRYEHAFPGLRAPRPPSFNALPTSAPGWLADHPPLTQLQIDQIDQAFRKRVQAIQSVDDMVAGIQAALAAHRMLDNTYIVFSSDNGLHTGEYRLMPGKLTAFDTDIHVPLVIAGPGIPAGSTTDAIAENVDLADTFAQLAGTTMSTDGHTLTPLLHGGQPAGWRDAALIEHEGPVTGASNPDLQTPVTGNPPSYEAIRTQDLLYVEYQNGQRELYDLRTDPYELHNIAAGVSQTTLTLLHDKLTALENCHTGNDCWTAEHTDPLARAGAGITG